MLERMISIMEYISDRCPILSLITMQVMVPAGLLLAIAGTVTVGGTFIWWVERMMGII